MGVSNARNIGIDIAMGEYICFVDSDDFLDTNLLEVALNDLKKNDFDVLCFNFRVINGNGVVYTSGFTNNKYEITSEFEYLNYVCNTLFKKGGWAPWAKLFKASIIKENKLYFYDRSKVFAEDLLFYLCVLLNTKRITVINKTLYNYIESDNSYTITNKETRVIEFVKLSLELYNYIKIRNLSYLKKNFYILFYFILDNRCLQSNSKDVLKDMGYVREKSFLRRNLIKIIFNAKKVSEFISDGNKNALIYQNLQYYLYSGNNIFFRVTRMLLEKHFNT